jgi:antitoxin ParD1/3/4
MPRTTSFTLGEDLEEFVQEQVNSGAYASASEVVRVALERMAEQERKEAALYAALDAGVKSGRAEPGAFARVRKRVGLKPR